MSLFLNEEFLQNIALLGIRAVLAAAIYIYMLRNFKHIGSYAKFNGLSNQTAKFILIIRSILATLLLIGLEYRWASLGLIIIFSVSTLLHTLKWKSPFSAESGGWEYSLLLLVLSFAVYAFGVGEYVALLI